MKQFLLLAAVLLHAVVMPAAEGVHPFEPETMNGCYADGGIFRLQRELPAQEDGENVVISAAKPLRIFFQEDVFARKAGARPDELVQIKKSAAEYAPQRDDPEAKDGYIDYVKRASFPYRIETPGKYTVWFRIWVPSAANWRFFVSADRGVRRGIVLAGSIPAAKQWFWKKGFTIPLDAGCHEIEILQAMNGKRLSSILLTRDPAFVPQGDIAPSPCRRIRQGTILFKPAAPLGLEQWGKLSARKKGLCAFQVSTDGGKTFRKLEKNDLTAFGKKSLVLKLVLTREGGSEPEAENIRASFRYDETKFIRLRAGNGEYAFSRENGVLTGIVNTSTGTIVRKSGNADPMFSLVLKTCGKNDRRRLEMKDARLVRIGQPGPSRLEIVREFPKERITVTFRIAAQKESLVWNVKVENNHPECDVIEVEAPVLSGLRLSGDPARDLLIWPFSAGEKIPFPAEKGEFSVTYPDHAGLPFAILTNGKESFYYACHDKKLLITEFSSAAGGASDSITLKITRKHRIRSGSSREDTFVTAVLNGTWHKGADLYREYFYEVYPKNTYRPWLRSCDGWLQGSACGHTGLMKRYGDYTAFQHSFKEAAFLSLNYIQMWGSTFNGACPAYYLPRLDKGGEKMFAEQMKFWRDRGGYVGHYYFANGIAPYYVLTDLYFGVPWSRYPAEYRPPSFDWYVKNREYISDSAEVNEAELREKTARINEAHRRNRIVRGNYEESTGYMSMNWRNGEFSGFLRKWIDIYVSRYHCNTAYLDTFAFRGRLADFNPHLRCNGEGDKAEFKRRFLEKLFADMRKKEPEFCALTEGIADVFGTHLYFLLSGFARDPDVFRYTLPDQIIFQGSSNGLWSKTLTKKSILQAFLCGNRFDLVRIYPETYFMLKLRQEISPFLNFAVFDDDIGVAVSDPAITVYVHKILPETENIFPGGGTCAVTLTIGNPEGKAGTVTCELPAGFRPVRAMLCEIYKDPRPLKFRHDGGRIMFQAPTGSASAAILIGTLGRAHRFTAMAEQTSKETVAVKIVNYAGEETDFTVDVGGVKKILKIPGSDSGTAEFRFPSGPEPYRILPVTVSAPGAETVRRLISVGETGQRIPIPEFSPRRAGKDLHFDFEETVFSTRAAASGKRGFLLKGNGKFRMHRIALDLAPGSRFEMTMKIRKSREVSPKAGDCFALIAFYTRREKRLVRLALAGGNIPNDGKFHTVKVRFDTPQNLYRPSLYLYNHNSRGELSVDDVSIIESGCATSSGTAKK